MVKAYYLKKYGKRFAGMVGASLLKKAASKTSNYVASSFSRKRKLSGKGRKPKKKPCPLPRKTVKCVKEIVKKEMAKESISGNYYKHYGGTLLLPGQGSNSQLAGDHIFWSQGLVMKQRLIFFQPHQFIDAASILFNGKTAALPDTGTTNDIADPQLKFNIIYASAKVKIKNHVQTPIEMTLYEVRCKDLESDFLGDDYTDALEATNLNQVGGTTFNRSTLHVKPTMFEALKTRYKIKEITKTLMPGDSITHYMKYKPNTLWKKQNNVDGNILQNVGKDTVQLFYSYRPAVVPIADDSTVKVGVLWNAQPLAAGSSTQNNVVSCDVHEIFKIECPEGTDVANTKDATCIFNGYEPVVTATTAWASDPMLSMDFIKNSFIRDT